MLLLNKNDIKQVFNMKDAIKAVKEAFMVFSEQKSVVPLRLQIPAEKHGGVFLFMPSYVADLDISAVKIINIFPQNAEIGKSTSPASILLMDGKTGEILALLDGTYVTQLRTGAASGAAFDVLAKKECRIGALIGTGGQAATQLEAMLSARELTEVRIYSTNPDRLQNFVSLMQTELKLYGVKLTAAKSSDEAIDNADLIIAATPSLKPVFDGNKVKQGATVSCVGSYRPEMQEIPQEVLKRASKIYFDSVQAVLSEAGDILTPLADKVITEQDFTGDLGDVLLGRVTARENDEEIIVFKTVGIGTQDLITAKRIYDKAVAGGIGTSWE